MAEPRGPHDPPIYLPPQIPKRLQSEEDVLNWSRWTIRSLARGAVEPSQGKAILDGLQKYLELKWLCGSGQKRMAGKDEQVKPLRDLDPDEEAIIKDRERRCREIQALADEEDAALAAAALIPQAVEAEAVEGSLVIDLAQIVAQARAQTAHLHLEKSPARAVEEAPLTAEEQHPEGNASAPRQPAYRPIAHPAIEVDRPPNLGRELAQEEF